VADHFCVLNQDNANTNGVASESDPSSQHRKRRSDLVSHHESGRSLFRRHLFASRLHHSKSVRASYLKVTKKVTELMQRRTDICTDSLYLAKRDTEGLAWQQPFRYNNITVTGNACCFPALNF